MSNAYEVAAQAFYEKTVKEYASVTGMTPEQVKEAPTWNDLDTGEQAQWIAQIQEVVDALSEAGWITPHPCGDWPAPCNCDDPETHNGH